MPVQWGIAQGNNALAPFGYGLQLGQNFAQQRAEKEHRNALLDLRKQELAGEQAKMAAQAQEQDIRRRAAAGDKGARAELAGIDINAWDKLNDNDKAALDAQMDAIGQAALRISQLPQEQQPMAWDAAIDQLSPAYPALAQYRGQYSPDALMSAIDQAKLVNDFLELERPRYQAIPEGGTLVNTSDPAAVQQYMGGLEPAAIPPAAIDFLRQNPNLQGDFDRKYGPGAAARVLGGGVGNGTGGFPGR